MILRIFTDGGSKGNPGPSSIGMVFYLDGEKIFNHHEKIGIATNNDAEYRALISALSTVKNKFLKEMADKSIGKIEFFSDSQLMVSQVNGVFKVKNGKIREYILQIRNLEQELGLPISYSHIPREKNKEADLLVNSV